MGDKNEGTIQKEKGEKVLFKKEIQQPPRRFSRGEVQRRKEAIDRANRKPLMEHWAKSSYWFPRAVYTVFHGVWIVVVSVGAFIAWLISFLLL